jgi:hypothetical protein
LQSDSEAIVFTPCPKTIQQHSSSHQSGPSAAAAATAAEKMNAEAAAPLGDADSAARTTLASSPSMLAAQKRTFGTTGYLPMQFQLCNAISFPHKVQEHLNVRIKSNGRQAAGSISIDSLYPAPAESSHDACRPSTENRTQKKKATKFSLVTQVHYSELI